MTDINEIEDPNGYCPSCKKPQDRLALCERCANSRDTKIDDKSLPAPDVTQREWK